MTHSVKLISTIKEYRVDLEYEGDRYEVLVEEEFDEDGEMNVTCRFRGDFYKWDDVCRFTDYVEENWQELKEIK